MANTTIQLKRSSVAGKQPNTSTLSIGELAINITDKKLYSSDGSVVFEPAANITNLTVTGGIKANGSFGNNSQVLTSNGSVAFWSTQSSTSAPLDTQDTHPTSPVDGQIYWNSALGKLLIYYDDGNTSQWVEAVNAPPVTSGNGGGGDANTAYSNAVSYVDIKIGNANTAMVANATAAYTNAVSYVDTKIGTTNTAITANAATAYTNAVSYVDTKIGTTNTAITANAATAYSNAIIFASNASNVNTGTLAEERLPYRMNQNVRTSDTVEFVGMTLTGNLVVSGNVNIIGANNLSISDNMIYLNSNNDVSNPDLGFAGNYNDGTYHHAGFFRDATDGVWKVFDNYDPEPDASVYIDTSNTSFHLADFQANTIFIGNTTVYATINTTNFTGTANNASYLGGTIASGYQTTAGLSANVATLTANNTSFVGTVSAANVVSNAQLSSNLTNYQTTAGLSANVATLTSNNASYLGGIAASSYTSTGKAIAMAIVFGG